MEKPVLRFNENGKFRVLMISDIHALEKCSPKVRQGIKALLDETNPDFVMIGGDQCLYRDTIEEMRESFIEIIEPILSRSIPWGAIFGNHDRERKSGIDLIAEQEMYETIPGCLSERGPENIHGVGNYHIPIFAHDSDDVKYNLWGMDSHRELWDFFRKYSSDGTPTKSLPDNIGDKGNNGATVLFNQVMWYYTESERLEKENGRKIPGVMFMHIPLPEYLQVTRNPEECGAVGSMRCALDCSEVSSGLFLAAVERGDIKGFFFGHEHLTDLSGTFAGITMACDAAIGYDMSGHDDLRGGRIIDLYENGRMQTRAVKLMDIMGKEAMRNPDYFEGGCSYFIRKL